MIPALNERGDQPVTVDVQTTYNVSTANGVSDTFAYSFQILSADDLQVLLDGVLATYLTDYTLTGVGSGSGGTVVMVSAPANGVVVTRQRSVVLERTTDYQQSGDFMTPVVNPDFDRLWMAVQDQSRRIDFTLQFPVSVTGWDFELPEPTADYVLFAKADSTGFEWRDAGNGVLAIPGDNSVTTEKLADISQYQIYTRVTAGSGNPEMFQATAAGLALLDDANASAQRTTLGATATGDSVFTIATLQALRALVLFPVQWAKEVTRTTITNGNPIPDDDTLPQSGEGTEVVTKASTLSSAGNYASIRAVIPVEAAGATLVVAALFRGTTCVASQRVDITASSGRIITLDHLDTVPGGTSVTYSVRVGTTAANIYVNGTASEKLADSLGTTISVTESIP